MQVTKGVFLFDGVGYSSNVYLVDGELIIDTGTGDIFPEIKEEMTNLGFEPDKIKLIVNTHAHYDHTGGDKKFRDWLKAKIAAHVSEVHYLENGDTLAELFNAKPKVITVDKILRDKDLIKTTNFQLEIIHTPGHSPGSICLYEKRKRILFSGDTLFEDGFGRTDYPGGNYNEILSSLKKLAKLDVKYLLSGHGMPKIGGFDFIIKQVLSGAVKHAKHR